MNDDNVITLTQEQYDGLVSAVEDRPSAYKMDDTQLASVLSAIGSLDHSETTTQASETELDALNRANNLMTYQLLTISILIGILVITFFRRK